MTLNNTGIYVKPYQNFDVPQEQLRIVLTDQNIKLANAINVKDTGIYDLIELVNNQLFFNSSNAQAFRNCYRKCFELDAIAAGASTTINHDITNNPDYRPIPYSSSTSTNAIEINVTSTQIYVANGATAPNIVSGIVVLEYLKQ